MPKVMTCPWFQYYVQSTVVCEGCKISCKTKTGFDLWTDDFCCHPKNWQICPINRERTIDYEQQEQEQSVKTE